MAAASPLAALAGIDATEAVVETETGVWTGTATGFSRATVDVRLTVGERVCSKVAVGGGPRAVAVTSFVKLSEGDKDDEGIDKVEETDMWLSLMLLEAVNDEDAAEKLVVAVARCRRVIVDVIEPLGAE